MTLSPRARARAMAAGRGSGLTLAVPIALRLAARISERPLAGFFTDPAQLAGGLSELRHIVVPDGLVVTTPPVLANEIALTPVDALAAAPRTACALEAARRLHQTPGDQTAVVAMLPGPAAVAELRNDKLEAGAVVVELAERFLTAAVDVLLFVESEAANVADFHQPLRTVANMARLYRTVTLLQGARVPFLSAPTLLPADRPASSTGLVTTGVDLPPETSIALVRDWVRTVRG